MLNCRRVTLMRPDKSQQLGFFSKIPACLALVFCREDMIGRKPAPVDRWFIRLFVGFQPSKVMQDFFHPQQHIVSDDGLLAIPRDFIRRNLDSMAH